MIMIDRYPAGWRNALQRQLRDWSAQFPGEQVFALIDGAHDESCHARLKQFGTLPFCALYADIPHADDETLALSPLLVEFRPEREHDWMSLLQRTDGLSSLSLIVTPESLPQLAHRLAPWCIVDADGQPLALSFADTRILPELVDTLTHLQWQQLGGPARTWQYVARHGGWKNLSLPEAAEPAADRVVLDTRQCAALIESSEPDHLLYQLQASGITLPDDLTPSLAYGILKFWLRCADHAQLQAAPARLALCEAGLSYPDSASDPRIAEWLEQPARVESLESLHQRWFSPLADSNESTSI